ncbi:hypothetical protein REPUB_Repub12eG0075900 [Reevesia pubescens]
MAGRVLSSASMGLRKTLRHKILSSNLFIFIPNKSFHIISSLGNVICKAFGQKQVFAPIYDLKRFFLEGHVWIHSAPFLNAFEKIVGTLNQFKKGASVDDACSGNGKAQKKEERYVTALKKIEPAESSEATNDSEILTPKEHFFFLKMGLKCKNYVPVGRRGIYQGVILNMHLY